MAEFYLYGLFVMGLMLIYVGWNHKTGVKDLIIKLFGKYALLFRISASLTFIIIIIGIAEYLHHTESQLAISELAKFVIGGLVVVGLFYSILAFEFNVKKTKNDYKTAKEILTFNTANEWHKAPIKDYQRISIEFEKGFIASKNERTAYDLDTYLEDKIEFKGSLKGILNYFENLSIGVHRGLIDKGFIFEFISYIFEVYYTDYYHYILYQRGKKNNDTIWINFTNLAEEWWPDLKANLANGNVKSTIITKHT